MSRWDDDGGESRGAFEDPKQRPLVPTDETRQRWSELGRARNTDPDYMRYLQSKRSHESLAQSGREGFRVTALRHGYDAAMEYSARYWRAHPEKASVPEQKLMGMLSDLDQERGKDYEHIYKTAPGVWSDFAWEDKMKAVEVWGGVHDADFRHRLDPENELQNARRDQQRIELMQARGWEVKVVMARELQAGNIERTREQMDRYLNPEQHPEQMLIPGIFEADRGEQARRYETDMKVVQMLSDAGQRPGDDYARDYRVTDDTEPVGFAWIDSKRAAHVYSSPEEREADLEKISKLQERGWEVLTIREDRGDLTPPKRHATTQALLRWSRGEDE